MATRKRPSPKRAGCLWREIRQFPFTLPSLTPKEASEKLIILFLIRTHGRSDCIPIINHQVLESPATGIAQKKIMSFALWKQTQDSLDDALSQQDKINEVRKQIGSQSGKLSTYCSDACIARYLRARNWNVKKAVKMLKATLKWRSEYKPDEIRWDDIAEEAETGKLYQSNYKDKHGRPVLIMRPRCQNSKSVKEQIKYLVYCMEKAISDLTDDVEQMVWLIDFHGFSLSNVSINASRETAYVLQEHYPERLAVSILYDSPKIFQPFWKVSKPFLDAKTAEKVKFVYSNDPDTRKILDELFEMETLDSSFGGKDSTGFEIEKYAERMREYDRRRGLLLQNQSQEQ